MAQTGFMVQKHTFGHFQKCLPNPDKIDALNKKTPSIDLVCTLLYLESIYNALNSGRPHMALKNPAEDSQFSSICL